MKLRSHLMALFIASCTLAGFAQAEVTTIDSLAKGQVGKVYFKSVDRKTTAGQLSNGKFQLADTISGELILPEGNGPFPVMVVMHGSGGLSKNTSDWAEVFGTNGIGAFIVDSFTERGISQTASDQSQMTYPASAADALVALKLLATHPKVASNRIGVIGFSRGGQATVGSAFDIWRRNVADSLKYAVHLPFYGGCSWIADRWDGSPIHYFVGGADDYSQPVATCEAQRRYLDKAGIEHSLTIYSDARHGFDVLDRTKDVYAARAQTFRSCSYIWNVESQIFYSPAHSDQAKPASGLAAEYESCMTHGTTIGPNLKATKEARIKVIQILNETLLKR